MYEALKKDQRRCWYFRLFQKISWYIYIADNIIVFINLQLLVSQ